MDKVIYTGVFFDLSDKERTALTLQHFGRVLANQFLHHMTIRFKPSAVEAEPVLSNDGKPVTLLVIGLQEANGVQVFVIAPNIPDLAELGISLSNKVAHVTVGTDEGVKPFASNAVLKEHEWTPIEPFEIKGVLGAFSR